MILLNGFKLQLFLKACRDLYREKKVEFVAKYRRLVENNNA